MTAMKRSLVLAPLLLVLAAACGSDGDSSSDTVSDTVSDSTGDTVIDSTSDTVSDTVSDTGAVGESDAEEPDTEPEEASDAPSGGDGATLTLANGETFEFATVLCTLEPQMAAGSEILFTATSYDDPGLDITQFGNEGTITGLASISVYDGNFETLWEANSLFGSSVELTLDGSTIRGTGSFYEGEEFGGETVAGEVVANC